MKVEAANDRGQFLSSNYDCQHDVIAALHLPYAGLKCIISKHLGSVIADPEHNQDHHLSPSPAALQVCSLGL